MNVMRNVTILSQLSYKLAYHSIQRLTFSSFGGILSTRTDKGLLVPSTCTIISRNTLVHKVLVYKKCQDCYFLWKDGRTYVYCKKHPSHKQVTKVAKQQDRFIITHSTHGRVRPW